MKLIFNNFKTHFDNLKSSMRLNNTKKTGNIVYLPLDNNYWSKSVQNNDDAKIFTDKLKEFFGSKYSETDLPNLISSKNNETANNNYLIYHNGDVIGCYSLYVDKKDIQIYNYGVNSELRNSKSSLNAILTVRDNIQKILNGTKIHKIFANVDIKNYKLIDMYGKFGFFPIDTTYTKFKSANSETEGFHTLLKLV